jgi:hypothetical protein
VRRRDDANGTIGGHASAAHAHPEMVMAQGLGVHGPRRRGAKKAIVVLARRLAVVMYPCRWTVRNSVGARKLMPPPRCEEGPGVPSSGGRAPLAGRVRREHGSAQQDDVQIVPPFPSEPHHVAAIAPASEREARTPRDGTAAIIRRSGLSDEGNPRVSRPLHPSRGHRQQPTIIPIAHGGQRFSSIRLQ